MSGMGELHADLDEQRQAEEWAEYLAWFEDECKLNERNRNVDLPEIAAGQNQIAGNGTQENRA